MLTWTPAYEIGVPEIDAQHRTLFERAGMLAAAVQAGEPYDRLEDLFTYLARYAVEHFEAEERLMREVGYPGLAEHASQHLAFRTRLLSLIPQWDSEGASRALLLAMLGFLDSWLDEHITDADRRIAAFVRG
jgi:hemerythrin